MRSLMLSGLLVVSLAGFAHAGTSSTPLAFSSDPKHPLRPEAEKLLAEQMGSLDADDKQYLEIASFDLNDDGSPEIFAFLKSPLMNGNQGAPLSIFSKMPGGQWKSIGDVLGHEVAIGEKQINGWRSVKIDSKFWFYDGSK